MQKPNKRWVVEVELLQRFFWFFEEREFMGMIVYAPTPEMAYSIAMCQLEMTIRIARSSRMEVKIISITHQEHE